MPNILFLLLKRRKILDFHRCDIPSYISFQKQSFIEPHTVNSKVYFKNIEFNYLIRGVILDFLSTFSVHHHYSLDHHFAFLRVISLALSIILYLLGVIFIFLVHIIVFTTIYLCLYHLSQKWNKCSCLGW